MGVDCNFLTVCTPSCDVSRVCYNGSCDSCSQGYSGDNCTCVEDHICDPTGGHCDVSCIINVNAWRRYSYIGMQGGSNLLLDLYVQIIDCHLILIFSITFPINVIPCS